MLDGTLPADDPCAPTSRSCVTASVPSRSMVADRVDRRRLPRRHRHPVRSATSWSLRPIDCDPAAVQRRRALGLPPARLGVAMAHHHYPLQALLYSVGCTATSVGGSGRRTTPTAISAASVTCSCAGWSVSTPRPMTTVSPACSPGGRRRRPSRRSTHSSAGATDDPEAGGNGRRLRPARDRGCARFVAASSVAAARSFTMRTGRPCTVDAVGSTAGDRDEDAVGCNGARRHRGG